jgi:DNA-binding GntR family transcriptional regulator
MKEAGVTMLDDDNLDDGVRRAGPPAHQKVYAQLRERILFGDLAPGQPVTIQGIVADLGVGMTPVREALRRLTAEGALIFQGNRRISVPVLTAQDLDDVGFMRGALEPELARRATPRAMNADIDQLESIDIDLDRAIAKGDVGGYLRLNYAFHDTLYAIAGAPMIAGQVDALWLRFGPSLRDVLTGDAPQSLPDQHKLLIVALRRGDAQSAAQAVAADVAQGVARLSLGLAPALTL